MTNEQINHKPGCDALGGYGHGVGPCTCKDAAGASEGQAEPVAWARADVPERLKSPRAYSATTELLKERKDGYIPLYTHPSAEIAALREQIAELEAERK